MVGAVADVVRHESHDVLGFSQIHHETAVIVSVAEKRRERRPTAGTLSAGRTAEEMHGILC